MLIKDEVLVKIISGEITVLFRRWSRPGAKTDGTQMTQAGVIGIDSVEVVRESEITDADAVAAGYVSKAELIEHLNYRDDDIYRIGVRFVGEDPRIALRENAELSEAELAGIVAKLEKMDKRGAWTRTYLEAIESMPATYSGLLANFLDVAKDDFKARVRKLKALGLTESLEVGYRLSPGGEKMLDALRQKYDY